MLCLMLISRPSSATAPDLGADPSNDLDSQTASFGGEMQRTTDAADPQNRSQGNHLEEMHRLVNEILEQSVENQRQNTSGGAEQSAQQVEHVREDEDADTQALGAATLEDQQRLADLAIIDDADERDAKARMDMDIDDENDIESGAPAVTQMPNATTGEPHDEAKALTQQQIVNEQGNARSGEDVDMDEEGDQAATGARDDSQQAKIDEKETETLLQDWITSERQTVSGSEIWRRYSTLTSDLSYQLCEQLRLILQPTLATRLQGDYRTGKRLNMRKIIPYIASEYTKDKIWLRRTKPSRREYQVLLSLDDSRSMADSKSVHLAYQTLALVSQALTKLEVGQIGIARFGEDMDVLHPLGSEPFTDAEGATVLEAFTFQQHRTDVARLLEESLDVLASARQSQSSSTSGDLWQLQIIISDGVCQDHTALRKMLRKALQDRVMIVFLVIDSLQSTTMATATSGNTHAPTPVNKSSILNMQTVSYKEVNGEMKIEMERYLDTFPFEYYVVLRDVDALPQVLSETLRQWMVRVSSSEE